MSWQDRDYARPRNSGYGPPMVGSSAFWRQYSLTTILIVINVAVFFLCVFTVQGRIESGPIFQFAAMESRAVLHGQIWRLLTCEYLHYSPAHLLFNMLGLYFFGRPIEQMWGRRKFFWFYSIAGVVGSLFLMVLTTVGWFRPTLAAGASGSVLGLVGAAAFLFPAARVFILPIPFPIKIRVFAFLYGAWFLVNVLNKGNNAGGDACHLAGLVFGVWFAWRGNHWWRVRVEPVVSRMFGKLRTRRLSSDSFRDTVSQRRADAATIDRILTKVRESGIASLTSRERQALSEATRREQMRDDLINRQTW